jgi:hypothetical protein
VRCGALRWEAVGQPFDHSLLGRPVRTYGLDLGPDLGLDLD